MDKTAAKTEVYAKLNLALDITGTDKEGYHLLDMINCTVGVCDTLAVSRAPKISVTMDGKPCGAENTAYRAAEAIERLSGVALAVDIVKGIPFGAGMGGSSADASAVLRYAADEGLISRTDAEDAARGIGSDVVYMMTGGMMRARGRGDVLTPLPQKNITLAIVRRQTGASTAEVYRMFDKIGGSGAGIDAVLDKAAPRYNVLERPAIELCPDIARLKEEMRRAFGDAVMTGSGSAVCSVVDDREEAERVLSQRFGDCPFAVVTETVPFGLRRL